MVEPFNAEPVLITQGDTISWIKELASYPAPTWTLTYYFNNNGPAKTLTAIDNGDKSHVASISTAFSDSFEIGDYRWQAKVTNGSDVVTVCTGCLSVEPNLANNLFDVETRSKIKQGLDAIEAVLAGNANRDQESYTINNISVKRYSVADLWLHHARFKAAYERELVEERLKNGLSAGNKVLTRINNGFY